MKNSVLVNSIRFIALVLVQVSIFNNINFLGYINPLPYVLFIIAFPFRANNSLTIFLAFVLGVTLDFFDNSGGVHATACLISAYIRPILLRFAFGISFEYQSLKLSVVPFNQRLIYISAFVIIHHLVLFSLEVFNLSSILYILQKTLFTSIFTIFLCVLFQILFSAKPK